jgi:hypothetical protein
MKRLSVTILSLFVLLAGQARADAPVHAPAPPAPTAPPAPATAAEIRAAARPPALEEALRAALAETAESPPDKPAAIFGGDARTAFERQFGEARVPHCLHSEGLKRQPTFFLSGYIALPFVLVARARGKCLF